MGIIKETVRSYELKLKAGVPTEIFFKDTQPHMFHIRNYGNFEVFLSDKILVSSSNYIMKVISNGTRKYTNIKGLKTIYFLCESDTIITVETAEVKDLQPQDLDETQVTSIITSIVATNVGITGALPTGGNVIGKVDVNTLPINNFTPKKVTLSAGVDNTVKAGAGYISSINTALTDLLVKNNSVEVWKGNYSAGNPIYNDTNIVLNSVAGGVVYIVYK